eukprot:1148355-Pelagomonas_calceolata.AAC.1
MSPPPSLPPCSAAAAAQQALLSRYSQGDIAQLTSILSRGYCGPLSCDRTDQRTHLPLPPLLPCCCSSIAGTPVRHPAAAVVPYKDLKQQALPTGRCGLPDSHTSSRGGNHLETHLLLPPLLPCCCSSTAGTPVTPPAAAAAAAAAPTASTAAVHSPPALGELSTHTLEHKAQPWV